MVNNIYSIYDKVAEMYSKPFILNPKVAMRNFNFMAKNWKEEEVKDQVICLIGTFDDQTAAIETIKPKWVFELENAWESEHNG